MLVNNNSNNHINETRNEQDNQPEQSSFLSEVMSTILYIVVISGIFMLIQYFLFALVSVDGQSMAPTLEHNDRLVLNKVSSIDRFDIVVFPAPDDPEKKYIKRVIGVPGDEIEYREDVLYLNGEQIDEPYLDHFEYEQEEYFSSYITGNFSLQSLFGTETVPEGHYFVLGDNRLNSRDSRSFGFIDGELIDGETQIQLWPLDEIGMIDEN